MLTIYRSYSTWIMLREANYYGEEGSLMFERIEKIWSRPKKIPDA